MFHCPKSIAVSVARWVDGDNEESSWSYGDELIAPIGGMAFELWHRWRQGGGLDWLNLPLYLWARINVIDYVYNTWKTLRDKKRGMNHLDSKQLKMMTWIENG